MAAEPEVPPLTWHTGLFGVGAPTPKFFEARYFDLLAHCRCDRWPFGVVMLRSGKEVRQQEETIAIETTGTRIPAQEVVVV